ncbi:MAG: hypothetical protein H8E35_09160 [Ardenticatenia bacterium]|nr:hypothetical protein [Ardenticatenia bacterium]
MSDKITTLMEAARRNPAFFSAGTNLYDLAISPKLPLPPWTGMYVAED